MLYQEVRPNKLKDIIGNKSIIDSISKLLGRKPGKQPHTYMLAGPSGCGKTTIARIMAKEFGYDDLGIEELNAANTRGIDTVRQIVQGAHILPLTGTAKCYILDESHQLTNAAQQALLKIIEDCPSHCYFFFCTTDPQNIIKTIHNRCTRYDVQLLGRSDIMDLLQRTLDEEATGKNKDILQAIADIAGGSPRTALVHLEKILGVEDEDTIIDLLLSGTEKDSSIWDIVSIICSAPKVRRKKWKIALALVNKLDNDSEDIRRTLVSCLLKKMSESDDEEDILDYIKLLQLFDKNIYYGGKALLGSLIVQACFIDEL